MWIRLEDDDGIVVNIFTQQISFFINLYKNKEKLYLMYTRCLIKLLNCFYFLFILEILLHEVWSGGREIRRVMLIVIE